MAPINHPISDKPAATWVSGSGKGHSSGRLALSFDRPLASVRRAAENGLAEEIQPLLPAGALQMLTYGAMTRRKSIGLGPRS